MMRVQKDDPRVRTWDPVWARHLFEDVFVEAFSEAFGRVPHMEWIGNTGNISFFCHPSSEVGFENRFQVGVGSYMARWIKYDDVVAAAKAQAERVAKEAARAEQEAA